MFNEIVLIDYRRPLAERAKARKVCGPYRWRPAQPMTGRGFYQDSHGLRMDRAGSSFALRLDWANDHLRGSRLARINGYYCDPDPSTSDTLQPIIARLPHARGFLAGYTMGAGMAASLDAHIWPSEEEAARAAHDVAERDAERSREAQEREDEKEAEAEESSDPGTIEKALCLAFDEWTTQNGLAGRGDANELLHGDLMPEQRKWVSAFVSLWEASGL